MSDPRDLNDRRYELTPARAAYVEWRNKEYPYTSDSWFGRHKWDWGQIDCKMLVTSMDAWFRVFWDDRPWRKP